ncbi:MAG: hypothetical protein IPG89_10060 [Bacteroidetes bacterium]|nr:hypothetical protein [Bacteroidota bacterium]
MLRIYIPIAFLAVFLGWVIYRLFIKRDLKKQVNNLMLGGFFFGVWGLIYLALK